MLKPVEGIFFNFFTEEDVVRHHLVQRIVRAYDERSRNQQLSLELPREKRSRSPTSPRCNNSNLVEFLAGGRLGALPICF